MSAFEWFLSVEVGILFAQLLASVVLGVSLFLETKEEA